MIPSLAPPVMHVDDHDAVAVEYFDPEEDLPGRRLMATSMALRRAVGAFAQVAEKNRLELMADRVALTLD